jgi:hypothetical protein
MDTNGMRDNVEGNSTFSVMTKRQCVGTRRYSEVPRHLVDSVEGEQS